MNEQCWGNCKLWERWDEKDQYGQIAGDCMCEPLIVLPDSLPLRPREEMYEDEGTTRPCHERRV